MGKKLGVAFFWGWNQNELAGSVDRSQPSKGQSSYHSNTFSFSLLWSLCGDRWSDLPQPKFTSRTSHFPWVHWYISNTVNTTTCLLYLPLSPSMAHLGDFTLLLHAKQICDCNLEGKEGQKFHSLWSEGFPMAKQPSLNRYTLLTALTKEKSQLWLSSLILCWWIWIENGLIY